MAAKDRRPKWVVPWTMVSGYLENTYLYTMKTFQVFDYHDRLPRPSQPGIQHTKSSTPRCSLRDLVSISQAAEFDYNDARNVLVDFYWLLISSHMHQIESFYCTRIKFLFDLQQQKLHPYEKA